MLYEKAKKIDVRKECVINEYIDHARIRQAAEHAEHSAAQTFEASNETELVSVCTAETEETRSTDNLLHRWAGGGETEAML